MKLEAEVADLEFLDTMFNLSTLWGVHAQLVVIREGMEGLKEKARWNGRLSEAAEYEKQLYFIRANLNNVEIVMLAKEMDIFEFDEFNLVCKN